MNNRQVSRVLAPDSDSRQNNFYAPYPGQAIWVGQGPMGPGFPVFIHPPHPPTMVTSTQAPNTFPTPWSSQNPWPPAAFPYRHQWQEPFRHPSPCAHLCRLSLQDAHFLPQHPGARDAQSSPPRNLHHPNPLSPQHGHDMGALASTQGAPGQGHWE